jgi:hypothetical protein
MSQRDYGLQPRVAASATLGTSNKRILNRNRFAVEGQIPALPRVEAVNPGLKADCPVGAKLGIHRSRTDDFDF